MNKTILGISTLVIGAGIILVAASSVSAYKGDPNVKGPYFSAERHEAMEKAFENKDFNAWRVLMQGRGRVIQVVNKDNFAKFAQAHEFAEDGKLAEANQIRTELGLNQHNGLGQGMGMGRNGR